MTLKELLNHFDNDEQYVDICNPILARICWTVGECKSNLSDSYMQTKVSSWKMTKKNTLEINL